MMQSILKKQERYAREQENKGESEEIQIE